MRSHYIYKMAEKQKGCVRAQNFFRVPARFFLADIPFDDCNFGVSLRKF